MMSNTRRSTRRAAQEIMFDLMPKDLIIKKEGLLSYFRNQETTHNHSRTCGLKTHIGHWEEIIKKWEIAEETPDPTNYHILEKSYT